MKKTILGTVVCAVMLALTSSAGAYSTGSGTPSNTNCSVSYGYGYSSWSARYQTAVSSGDTDCDRVWAWVPSQTRSDGSYYFSVVASQSNWAQSHGLDVRDDYGREGGFAWNP